MTDDAQLLRLYADETSEEAFAKLVRKHLSWVYQTSLQRSGGRADLAKDISQQVFSDLARNAKTLSRREGITGWLYTAVRFSAGHVMRAEARRRKYETAVQVMIETEAPTPDPQWSELRPLLDEYMDRLPKIDREALVMRYFSDLGYEDLGAVLGLSGDGARKRVGRALDKLRRLFARRGITSTVAALAALLAARANANVPTELEAAVTRDALAASVAPRGWKGLFHIMSTTKSALTIASVLGLAGTLAIVTGGIAVYELKCARSADSQRAEAQNALARGRKRLQQLQQAAIDSEKRVALSDAKIRKWRHDRPGAKGGADAKASAAARKAQAQANAKTFFATYPKAAAMLADYMHKNMANYLTPFFRNAGLTPAQTEQFLSRTAQLHIDTTTLNGSTLGIGQQWLSEEQAQPIIGEDAYERFQDYIQTGPAQGWAAGIAAFVKNGSAPLSSDQVVALGQAVANNSPDYASGAPVKLLNVDWANALAQAQATMSPQQWQQAQAFVMYQAVILQVQNLQNSSP